MHFCSLLYLLNSKRLMSLGGVKGWVWVSFVMSTCSTVFHSLISKSMRPRLWNQLPDWLNLHLVIHLFFQCLVGFFTGRDWGQEKGMTEDEMAGWHHWHESEWTPGVGDGHGGLACCDSWGHKESDTTERLNWSELNWVCICNSKFLIYPSLSAFYPW